MKDVEMWLKHHEGFESKPYYDTEGHLTIGFGRNLDALGISEDEAAYLLKNDIKRCIKELSQYSWYLTQPDVVRMALVNMCFMGINKLCGFTRMITALIEKDYTKASIEALDSKWANQVGQRAKDVAMMISMGRDEARMPNCS